MNATRNAMKKNKVVILDNGHGEDTPGKRSPDGLFREYLWCREFVGLMKERLERHGYVVKVLVTESNDISLSERVKRANAICKEYGNGNCVAVSIHNNAAGNGKEWHNATGWEAYTSPKYTNSDKLASLIYEEIILQGIKIRKDDSDGDVDKEANFKILSINCPVTLTENMFMDSKKDVEFLNSDEGVEKLMTAHVNGIRRYFEDRSGTHKSWTDKCSAHHYIENKCIMK